MENLSNIGRIFYGLAMAVLGFLTLYDQDLPYMMIPTHSWLKGHIPFVYISGALLIVAGSCMVAGKKVVPIAVVLGMSLLAIFCFYFIPFELMSSTRYMHFGEWEDAAKELALAGGAFIVAGCFSGKALPGLPLRTLLSAGIVLFSLTILSFGIDHFIYAKEAAGYIPSWIPNHLFWMYFCGVALLGSSIGILFAIKLRLMAVLLGAMIFTWFIILHLPKVIAAPAGDRAGEAASAMLALAYSGIAFMIAGANRRTA